MTDGVHAVVTGGGSGIGLAIARGLAEGGHTVTIMGRDPARLERARGLVAGAAAVACDVGNRASVDEAVAAAIDCAGAIGVLVNCAGVARTAAFERTEDPVWEEVWRVNVMGAVHTTRAALPSMRTLSQGRIINIASTASLKGYVYASAYVASKHAVLGMTRSLALELVDTAITANAICPGYTDTDIVRSAVETIAARTGRSRAAAEAVFTGTNPQGRLIAPDEVSDAVRWLVTPGARSVTGQAIVVAGGEIM